MKKYFLKSDFSLSLKPPLLPPLLLLWCQTLKAGKTESK